MSQVAVVGAGMIGRAWLRIFAQAGHLVQLWDPLPGVADQALASLTTALGPGHGQIAIATSLRDCVAGCDYVQESGPERLALRRDLFAELDVLAPPHAILASSTSGMAPSTFSHGLAHRERCLVAHPANPPHLLPLVEVCPAPWTSPAVVDDAVALLRRAGRKVAVLRKERDGFLLNRLQGALLAEAFRLIADDVADVDDIDNVVKHALGLRWAFMGPLETVDLNAPGGLADFCARYGALYESLQAQMRPMAWDDELVRSISAQRRARLPIESIADRQAWRDRELQALTRHLAHRPESA